MSPKRKYCRSFFFSMAISDTAVSPHAPPPPPHTHTHTHTHTRVYGAMLCHDLIELSLHSETIGFFCFFLPVSTNPPVPSGVDNRYLNADPGVNIKSNHSLLIMVQHEKQWHRMKEAAQNMIYSFYGIEAITV